MAPPLVLVAGAGVLLGLALATGRVGWPSDPSGEATLAVVGPLALLLGVLGGAGLLDALVDVTSPTLLPLALAYAAIPGLLVGLAGRAAADAPPRRAALVPVAGGLVALAGAAVGRALPIHDAAPALIGLGFLLVASATPAAVRDPGWTAPSWLPRGVSFALATLLGALVVVAALATAALGAPQAADMRWEVTVEAPDASGPQGASFTQPYAMGVHVPFLEAARPPGEDVLAPLRDDLHVSSEAGAHRLQDDERVVTVMVNPGQTVTVAADLALWGRTDHTGAFHEHRLPTRNVTVSTPTPNDRGNVTVAWRYAAQGNGCSVDVRLEAEIPSPGNATLEGGDELLEGGRLQAVCR